MKKSILLMMAIIACNAQATIRFHNESKKYTMKISGRNITTQTINMDDYVDLYRGVFTVQASDKAGQPLRNSKGQTITYEIPKKIIQDAESKNKPVTLNVSSMGTPRIQARVGEKFKYGKRK